MTLLVIGGLYAVLALMLFVLLLRSPRGYEDERGFHLGGDEPRPPEEKREASR